MVGLLCDGVHAEGGDFGHGGCILSGGGVGDSGSHVTICVFACRGAVEPSPSSCLATPSQYGRPTMQ